MATENLHHSLLNSEFSLDDITLPPNKIPDFEVDEVDLTSKLTNRITLKTPLISSPMDTVTGHQMAILMALIGGIGVIHYNYPKIEDQMREVERVRRYEAGFVFNPFVLSQNAVVRDVREAVARNGVSSYPVTEDGTLDTKLVGMITEKDFIDAEDPEQGVTKIMTPRSKLIVGKKTDTVDTHNIRNANSLIRARKLDTLPIVDEEDRVVALVTRSDLDKNRRYPLATKDGNDQLKVLVAVESRLAAARDRIMTARDVGASGIVVDSRNVYRAHLEIAKFTSENAPDLDVIIGNLVMPQVAQQILAEAGRYIHALRIGMGTGEACITTEALGLGRAMGSSLRDINEIVRAYRQRGNYVGMITDGGLKSPAHIISSFILGADAVMMGGFLAGLKESPQDPRWDEGQQRQVKTYRGMGSSGAIAARSGAGANRYMLSQKPTKRFAEGIEKVIPYKGDGEEIVQLLFAGVRQGLQGLGHRNIAEAYRDGIVYPLKRATSKGTL